MRSAFSMAQCYYNNAFTNIIYHFVIIFTNKSVNIKVSFYVKV